MNLESITNEIIELNNKIKELEQLREEELKKEEYWYMTPYKLEIKELDGNNTLNIECNHCNYFYAKENNQDNILYLGIDDNSLLSDASISLNLPQVKQLSEYILKVINYMEDK